jgi:hypothetical protein
MVLMRDIYILAKLGHERQELRDRLDEIDTRLHPLMRRVHKGGASYGMIAHATGLTRQRIFQIIKEDS